MPYWYKVLIAVDQLANTLLWGSPDETLSSRAYRNSQLEAAPKKRWRVVYSVVNKLFFDPLHCKKSYESEKNRTQLSKDFR